MTDTLLQDPAAERAVLGSALMGSSHVHDAAGMLTAEDFHDVRHGILWDAILRVAQEAKPDPVRVAGALGADLPRVGGHPALLDLASVEAAPNPAALLSYAERVLDAALRRRLVNASIKVQQLAHSAESGTQAAEDARQAMDEAASQARTAESGVAAGDALEAAVDWLETPPVGAATPWADVNDRTNGLLAGQMVTVAARPGHGKSLALKDVALFTAMQGRPVYVATLEMSRNEYLVRILCSLARVDLGKALRRELADDEWQRIGDASEKVRGLPLYLDDRERLSMAQIRAAARETSRRYGQPLGLVGIDYAQLVAPADRRIPREQQVAQISRDTKLLAKEQHCPVMLLAQLNRGNTQRTDPTPVVSDLRESGALEQDSDQVWLLHRPDQYPGDENQERFGEVDLIVGKNRNGPAPLTIPLGFQGWYARIVSLA